VQVNAITCTVDSAATWLVRKLATWDVYIDAICSVIRDCRSVVL
jgi:hypothetical protein